MCDLGIIIAPASEDGCGNKMICEMTDRACHIVRATEALVIITILIVIVDEELRPRAVKTVAAVTQPWGGRSRPWL